jgi:hypothetical protein
MKAKWLLGLLLVGSCSQPVATMARPPGGYDAIRLRETVQFQSPFFVIRIPAGSVLVADRPPIGGRQYFCGIMVVNDGPRESCVSYDGSEIIFKNAYGWEYPQKLRPEAIERIKS